MTEPDANTFTDERYLVRDCEFLQACATFNDDMIDYSWKMSRGCKADTDLYRSNVCAAYRCQALSSVFSDVMKALNGAE